MKNLSSFFLFPTTKFSFPKAINSASSCVSFHRSFVYLQIYAHIYTHTLISHCHTHTHTQMATYFIFCSIPFKKTFNFALAGVAHLIECHHMHRRITGFILGQGICLGCRFDPHQCFSPIPFL